MRGRGLSPHHVLPGPPRRAFGLQSADGGRQGAVPHPAFERQLRLPGRGPGWEPLGRMARSVAQAQLPVRAGGRRPRRQSRHIHHAERAQGGLERLGASRRSCPHAARDGFADRGDEVGRGDVRPRVRPRPLQHRRRFRLQHGGDGEQGPKRLQHPLRSRRSRHRHRRRLRRGRRRDRPRVFP
jgi:hypothetical protein